MDGEFLTQVAIGLTVCVFSGGAAIVGFLTKMQIQNFRLDLVRLAKDAENIHVNQRIDAENLERWKLTAVQEHSEFRGDIGRLGGIIEGNITQIQIDLRKLLDELPVLSYRVTAIEDRQRHE